MIAALEDIAYETGMAILPLFKSGNFESALKSDHSPVSSADILADKMIRERLPHILGIPILSEESLPSGPSENLSRFWCVDPIDGTKEFVRGSPYFTINIALIDEGVPVAGVIYAPALDHLCAAAPGSGLRFNRQAQSALSWPQDLTVVTSQSHPEPELESFMQREGYTKRIALGSSIKFSYIALGQAHCYPRFRSLSIWDIAAGHALVRAVGCSVLSLATGQPFVYSYDEHRSPPFCVLSPGRQLRSASPASASGKKRLDSP